ncbi:glutamyl-tRNA reductase [Niabella beijingensis]|uniref:glutamyl-tRNA reductase n=1 Tax=Niabella beijingensis TaxID=2872700 RepID=UPI001CBCF042|nr:glutamyl-tRNA reductase [Niabella beijingensis]MBZ4189047.1 glutamyl-tRNA reductase [Niabella beijingensis]
MSLEEFHISKQVLDRFCIAGINYHKADAATRGLFSITNETFVKLGESAKAAGLKSVFVVSTCNRTEIYGFAESVMQLVELLVQHTNGDKAAFYECGYFKNGEEALQHLFNVAAGLDSQILGDYEILGQLKRAVETARNEQLIGPVMDRMLNFAFQASKRIKTETNLSDGTVSVSFAAIELLQNIKEIERKKVLIIGAGKFGVNVCKNLNTYLPQTPVTIMNRTDEVARQTATAHNIGFIPYSDKTAAIKNADIVIVCTNANEPTVMPEHVAAGGPQLFLDLSVPVNVHPAIRQKEQITVIDVDEISNTILDKTLAKRKAEVPKAQAIIAHFRIEFLNWLRDHHYSLHLKTWKNKLREIDLMQTSVCEFYKDKELISETERVMRAQKAVKQLAVNLKVRHDKGCQFISSINDYLQIP